MGFGIFNRMVVPVLEIIVAEDPSAGSYESEIKTSVFCVEIDVDEKRCIEHEAET